MKTKVHETRVRAKHQRRARRLARRQRRIQYRLRDREWDEQTRPMFRASNIEYDVADRIRGLDVGGIGAIHRMARRVGLIKTIDRKLHVLKTHKPYHESDHVLNVAYNFLAGGERLEDIELRRNNEVFMDALGTQRIPDPTTEGDFCRRFEVSNVEALMDAINETRLQVWKQQPPEFFEEAVIDGDGTLVPTLGECKQGIDYSYKGVWGYHPLLISLANTREPLFIVNRSGNRPSHEGAAEYFDRAKALVLRAGFKRVRLRGDTDFTQTGHLDRWDEEGVLFVFGMDARQNLIDRAESLEKSAWAGLARRPKYEVRTEPREKPERYKEQIVIEREFDNIRLVSEHVAEFEYRPSACKKSYRVVVLRKNLSVEKGELRLFDDVRYFFYITNDCEASAAEIIFESNDRCDQENLIDQLKNGVRALNAPVDNLVSNWAYMVMASLAWTLKAWFALLLPAHGRWAKRYREEKASTLRMEFKKFVNAFVRVPAQVIRTGRRIVFRLLSWNPFHRILLRAADAWSEPLRC